MFININSLEQQLKTMFESNEIESFLALLTQMFFEMLSDPRFRGQALFEPISDGYLQKLALSLCDYNLEGRHKNAVLHVATEVYDTGGHTRVLEDIVANLPDKRHVLVLTGGSAGRPPQLSKLLQERFATLGLSVIYLHRQALFDRVKELVTLIRNLAPHTIFLNAHHFDSVAYGAVCGYSAPRVHFLHHADHQPSLGATRTDYEHFDLTPECHGACRKHLKFGPKMLHMSAADHGMVCDGPTDEATSLVCVTSGSAQKFHGEVGFSYPQLASALLKAGVDRLHHIGPFPDVLQQHVRNQLAIDGSDPGRIVFEGPVPSLVTRLKEIAPDFYLESHPVGGGKARVEALALGLPILRAEPPEKLPLFRWVDGELGSAAIISHLGDVPAAVDRIRTAGKAMGASNREFYQQFHAPDVFRQKLLNMTEPVPAGL